ncbi:MAG: T9SS type A sorting domain-containing protein [Phaeodactylibacter sp.]|uniref:T9SS type A sorting domain-containing protein n=1 Tax=Phaeodactylibacter sp. TaxID=1940289 RepID=UPI0032F0047D
MNIMTLTNPFLIRATGLAFAVMLLAGWTGKLYGQCPAPANVTVGYDCNGAVTLDWDGSNEANTYTVDIENGNQPVVDFVNMTNTQLTIVGGTLSPGVTYNYAITANCGASNVSSATGQIDGGLIQNELPEIQISNVVNPECGGDDGSFDVVVNDVADDNVSDCNATYNVVVSSAGSEVDRQNGVASGETISFSLPGTTGDGTTYIVALELVDEGDCTLQASCVGSQSAQVTLAAFDNTAPEVEVTGSGGVPVNPGVSFSYDPPEGECGVQLQWSVLPSDNCESPSELDFEVTLTNPNPGAAPTVSFAQIAPDAAYIIDLFLAVGENTLTITATDGNGNSEVLDYVLTVNDSRAPEVYGPGNMNVEIPACQNEGVPVNWTIAVNDDCDTQTNLQQTAGPASGSVFAAGTYNISYTATDYSGNATVYSFSITVTQANSPEAIVDISGNGQFHIPACESTTFAILSGNIYDCNISAEDDLTGAISVSGAPLTITYTDTEDGFAYFEATGNLTPGTYLVAFTYDGVTVDHVVDVIQDANQAANIKMPGNLSFLEPICTDGANLSFQVQITDDCDTDLSGATFTLNGASAPAIDPGASDPLSGLYVWNLAGIPAGTYTLVASYTDGAGDSSEGTAQFVVTDQPDNAAPIIVYPSQNINVTLDPCGPANAEVTFQVSAIDDCEGAVVPDVSVSGSATIVPSTGNTYVVTAPANQGPFIVTIVAEDGSGNSRTETFAINAAQAAAPATNLACNDNIIVTLNDNCARVITADMVLEGNFGCLTEADFTITIVNDLNPSNGNVVDGDGQFIYDISGPNVAGFANCWGYVTAEDKTAPVITCPDDTDEAIFSTSVQKLQGQLTTTDAQLELANYSCFLDAVGPTAGDHYYDIIEFQVSTDDIYTIYLNTSWGDGFTALYQGSFNPNSPCENILYAADDNILGNAGPIGGVFDPQVRVTLPLRAYETYYVLVSSFGADVTGSYEHTIFSDGNGLIGAWNYAQTTLPDWTIQYDTLFSALPSTAETLTAPLFCDDFDFIYGGDAGSVAQQTAFIEGTYGIVGAPSATDNCDNDVDITATDDFTFSGDCGDVVITRTFTARDDNGRTDACQQQITFRKPTLDDVNLPSFTVAIECDEDYPTLADGNPSPELTGYPFIFTAFGIYDIAPSYCNIGASFDDLPAVDECNGRFKFRREWTIFDWCDPGNSLEVNQLIKVGDFTAPQISCPAGTPLVYSSSPFSCTAAFAVPMPANISDNCSEVSIYTEIVTEVEDSIFNQYGLFAGIEIDTVVVRTIQPGASRFVGSIPFGSHYFRYVAEDDCGNETELYCPFEVVDQIEPIAICDDQLNVSIGGGNIMPGQPAGARIFAHDVDEGSWDNCGDVTIQVFRNNFNPITNTCGTQNSVTGNYVDFFCCDIGITSDITLVVTDQYGNQNSCWLSVTPEDKINPFCDAPDNVVIDCDDLPYGFDATDADQLEDLFGMATGADNCGIASAQQVAANNNLDCGFGSITRIFRVTDVNGRNSTNSCVQVITVNEVHNYEIKFPKDAEAQCGIAEPDSVIYNEIGCDLLAISSSDETFSASGNECYKIFRTWKVINWCQYDGESAPYIVGRDEDCNGTPGDECVWLLARPNGKIYFDEDTDESPDNNVPGINFCGTSNDYYDFEYDETGFYQYTQIIKVYDDIAPEVSFTPASPFCSLDNVDCDATVVYPFTIEEDCTPNDLDIDIFLNAFNNGVLTPLNSVLSGTYPNFTITGTFPIGAHSFEVRVKDGCGNSDLAVLPFSVIDCKAPAPVCINGIAIELMPVDENGDNLPDPGAGMAEIWASDFVASAITDCSEPIKYSINRAGEPNDPDQTGLVLTCDDEGTLVVEIWAYDAVGNGDFCETYILVQDNMGVCGDASPMAAGAISTEQEEAVEEVSVSLSGQMSDLMMTQADGLYSFTGLQPGLDYTVTPQRDGDDLNGVSTFDLVLISKHILGVDPLDSPYQQIAADVNKSGTVTTLDLIQLRKLILSITTEFTDNTSWRFVEASYVFPNPSNPWAEQFPEVINFNDLPAGGISNANFVAVKIGDVSGDAAPTNFTGIDERSYEGTFALQTAEQELKAGNEYRLNFTAAELAAIEGYQATLTLTDAVELIDIVSGIVTEANFGLVYAGEGKITTSWNWASEASAKAPTGAELFTLVLRANSDAMLSEVLGVSSAVTKAEAYGKDGSFREVAIEFGNGTVAGAGFELYQNQPNPFNGETVIGFKLPEAAQATVTISDVTGKVLKVYRQESAKGYNQITVKAADLAAAGVVSYTVTAGSYSATKKMVIVE